jgi:ketopantoate hydroxymethyltransferase
LVLGAGQDPAWVVGAGPAALALEDAGAFAIVLEAIPDTVAEAVTHN